MTGATGTPPLPDISVVIPTYDRARLVVRAVQSVLAQQTRAAEVIVVDDGSTDDTSERLAPFAGHVRYLWQENAGSAAARNTGVRQARCEWVAFLDSDDVWSPDHIGTMASAIAATEGDASFYFSDIITARADGKTQWELAGFDVGTSPAVCTDSSDWVMLPLQPMMVPATVFRRRNYLDVGGMWEVLPMRHDTHLYFLLGLGGAACAVPGAAARFTADDTSDVRLAASSGPSTFGYWVETALLYDDVLRRGLARRPEHRHELEARLAIALRRLARMKWQRGERREAVGDLVRAARLRPLDLGRRAVGRVRHGSAGAGADQAERRRARIE